MAGDQESTSACCSRWKARMTRLRSPSKSAGRSNGRPFRLLARTAGKTVRAGVGTGRGWEIGTRAHQRVIVQTVYKNDAYVAQMAYDAGISVSAS